MASLAQIISSFTTPYPNVSGFLCESHSSEHIVDDNQLKYSVFSNNINIPGFDVKNPNGIMFYLLQIDNRLIVAHRGGQCDCAFLYDDSINLLEFKTNASSVGKVTKNYNKAENQIKNTIIIFKNNGIDLLALATDVEAHICFNNSYPRKKANEQSRAIAFAKATGGIGLFFENNKAI